MADKPFNITLTIDDLNLVLGALGELPAKASMSLIIKIREQAQQQSQSVEAETVEGN